MNSSGNSGCYYKGKDTATSLGNIDTDIDLWTPALYGPQNVSEISITIRHSSDPFILASELTSGTYNFGPSLVSEASNFSPETKTQNIQTNKQTQIYAVQLEKLGNGIILVVVGGACIIGFIVGDYFLIRYLVSSGRGDKRKFRDGGLESRSVSIGLQDGPGAPKSPPPAHSHPHHPPRIHIIDIYMTPK